MRVRHVISYFKHRQTYIHTYIYGVVNVVDVVVFFFFFFFFFSLALKASPIDATINHKCSHLASSLQTASKIFYIQQSTDLRVLQYGKIPSARDHVFVRSSVRFSSTC